MLDTKNILCGKGGAEWCIFSMERTQLVLRVGFSLKANVPEKGLASLEKDFQGKKWKVI